MIISRTAFLAAAALAAAASFASAPAAPAPQPRKVYAHYMGCWPAAVRALPWSLGRAHLGLSPTNPAPSYVSRVGGGIVNWPLLPQRQTFTDEQSAVLEIKRAIRAGIDGFAFDAWAGGDSAASLFDYYFKIIEKHNLKFELTVCFDPSCLNNYKDKPIFERYLLAARHVLKHKDSPHLARFKGKPLFFGYYSEGILESSARAGKSTHEVRQAVAQRWREFRAALDCPVYVHGSLDSFALSAARKDWDNPPPSQAQSELYQLGLWAGKVFDAVGAFIGEDRKKWRLDPNLPAGVKASGADWAQPLMWQYDNKLGGIHSGAGLSNLYECYASAELHSSPLMQFVTWNDYGEETVLAPAYCTGYTPLRVHRHLAAKWKNNGVPPPVEKDEIHFVFRRSHTAVPPYPFRARNPTNLSNNLEVITFLTAPAKIVVPNYGEYEAPAGFHSRLFPIRPGKVSAHAVRGRLGSLFPKTVLSAECPEQITDKPWREDLLQYCWGTNYREEWETDFPGVPPLEFSEYGDADSDGLPNWFEMLHAGQFPFMDTATNALPHADWDGDGFTNLQEYEARTNPLKPGRPLAPGYKWDIADLTRDTLLTNPSPDPEGRYVWHFFYGGTKPRTFTPAETYPLLAMTGGMCSKRDTYGVYITKGDNAFMVRGSQRGFYPVGWRAPVAGKVQVEAKFTQGKGHGTVHARLMKGTAELIKPIPCKGGETHSIPPVQVQVSQGETIYLIFDHKDSWGIFPATLEKFQITLL